MADEIKVTISATITNGFFKDTFSPGQDSITQVVAGGHSSVMSVSTTAENISFGDVATPGYAFFQNIDATNYVHIGIASTGGINAFCKLLAGECATLRLTTGSTFMAEADTLPVKMFYKCWEA